MTEEKMFYNFGTSSSSSFFGTSLSSSNYASTDEEASEADSVIERLIEGKAQYS
jgi:hypothetical protein